MNLRLCSGRYDMRARGEFIFTAPVFLECSDALEIKGLDDIEQNLSVCKKRFEVGFCKRSDLTRFGTDKIDKTLVGRRNLLLAELDLLGKFGGVFIGRVGNNDGWVDAENSNSRQAELPMLVKIFGK